MIVVTTKDKKDLGSAKGGFRPWYRQQLAAFALLPLVFYTLASFSALVLRDGSFEASRSFVEHPLHALSLLLLVNVGFYHGAGELRSIVDDYVHHRFLHLFAAIKITFGGVLFAACGSLAILKIFLGA